MFCLTATLVLLLLFACLLVSVISCFFFCFVCVACGVDHSRIGVCCSVVDNGLFLFFVFFLFSAVVVLFFLFVGLCLRQLPRPAYRCRDQP